MRVESFKKIDKKTYQDGAYASVAGVLRFAWVVAGQWSDKIDDMVYGHSYEVVFKMYNGMPYVLAVNPGTGQMRYFIYTNKIMCKTQEELDAQMRPIWLDDLRKNVERARLGGRISLDETLCVLEEAYGVRIAWREAAP